MPKPDRKIDFRHLPEYRVLLCTACSYCVLPRALDRHLKDIHRLTQRERGQLLDKLLALDLADHDDVRYPSPGEEPIFGLPIHNGLACGVEDCSHLCITVKRMQAHWRTEHPQGQNERGLYALNCRPVKIQTFFKGGFLRYFVVSDLPGVIHSSTEPVLYKAPIPTNYNESSTDWWLTGQFFDSSYHSFLPVLGTDISWREKLLQIGQSSDYLRYAVLSMTASHVAYTYPECRDFYRDEASRYHQLSLRTIARRVQAVNDDNFYAVFNFSRLMNLCCIAAVQLQRLDNTLDPDQNPHPSPMVPPWIRTQHLGSAIISPHAGGGRMVLAMHGRPHHSLSEPILASNPFDDILADLASQLASLSVPENDNIDPDLNNHVDPSAEPACVTVLAALRSLRIIWSVPYQTATSGFRDAALMWTARLSPAFLALLTAHYPPALIVFAHYCVLWSVEEEQYWYMRGHAEGILREIRMNLGEEWWGWIAWPWAMIFGDGGEDGGFRGNAVIEVG